MQAVMDLQADLCKHLLPIPAKVCNWETSEGAIQSAKLQLPSTTTLLLTAGAAGGSAPAAAAAPTPAVALAPAVVRTAPAAVATAAPLGEAEAPAKRGGKVKVCWINPCICAESAYIC